MMAMLEAMDGFGYQAAKMFLSLLWQSSILFAAAAMVAWLLRRRSAALRQRVWLVALAATAMLPLLGWLASRIEAPRNEIAILPQYAAPETQEVTRSEPLNVSTVITGEAPESMPELAHNETSTTVSDTESAPAVAPAATTQIARSKISIWHYPWAIGLSVYTAALMLMLLLVMIGNLRLRRWALAGQVVTDTRTLQVFRRAAQDVGFKRSFVVVESAAARLSLALGWRHPLILVPKGFLRQLGDEDLRAVAAHELTHMKRHDPLTLAAISVMRAVLFFHPLVWLAARRIAALAEQAADDAALAATGAPISYARLLSRLAENLPAHAGTVEMAAGFLFSRSAFLRRVEAILSDRRDSVRRLTRIGVAAVAVCLLGSLAAAIAVPLTSKAAMEVTSAIVAQAEQPEAIIRGVVTQAGSGQPVAGIRLALLRQDREMSEISSAVSGEDGKFELSTDFTGTAYLMAGNDKWCAQWESLPYRQVTLDRNTKIEDMSVTVVPAASFSGRVIDKSTSNPIADAEISGLRGRFSARTDKEGRFQIASLPIGMQVPFEVTAEGHGIEKVIVNPPAGGAVQREIALTPEVVISGQVTDIVGKPLAGAEVRGHSRGWGSNYYTTTTDEKGYYEIRRVSQGYDFGFSVQKDGYQAQSKELVIATDAKALTFDFKLPAGYVVAGQVVDEKGKPMSGIAVHWALSAYGPQQTRTDNEGRFRIEGIVGKYAEKVTAIADGYAISRVDVNPAEPEAENVLVTMKPEKRISGIVVDEEGKPLADAMVMVSDIAGTPEQTTSDRNGRFTLDKLGEETYSLVILARGYPRQQSQAIPAGATDARIVVKKGASLQGRVVDDATGAPVTRFNVRLGSTRGVSKSDVFNGVEFQDRDGRFDFKRPLEPQPVYRFIVVAPGYGVGTAKEVTPGIPAEIRMKKEPAVVVHVADGSTGKDIPKATGRFYYWTAEQPLYDYDGDPEQRIGNSFLPAVEGKPDGKGKYTFSGVGEGPWVLKVEAEGRSPQVTSFPTGVTELTIEVKLDTPGSLVGTIKGVGEMRPETISIQARLSPDHVQPGPDGEFRIENLKPGPLSVTLGWRNWQRRIGLPSVTIQPGQETRLDIDLAAMPTIVGHVTRNGKPVVNAQVATVREDLQLVSQSSSADDGSYEILVPLTGSYRIVFNAIEGKYQTEIEVKAGRQTVDAPLAGQKISGQVRDSKGVAVPGAVVLAVRSGTAPYPVWVEPPLMNLAAAQMQASPTGKFEVLHVSPGEYLILGLTNDYTSWSHTSEVVADGRLLVQNLLRATFLASATVVDGRDVEGVQLISDTATGVEVRCVDAATGRPIPGALARSRLASWLKAQSGPEDTTVRLAPLPVGKEDIRVFAEGYIGAGVDGVQVAAGKLTPVEVRLKRGGLLRLKFSLTAVPDDYALPFTLLAFQNLRPGLIATWQTKWSWKPNLLCGQSQKSVEMDMPDAAILPGEYDAVLYYFAKNKDEQPVGQFNLHFKIEEGKTTEISLTEADMKPFQPPMKLETGD